MHSLSENILYFVCGFGILQGLLLAGLIYLHPKSDRSVNKFLALYILTLSVIMTSPFLVRLISWQNSFFIAAIALLPGPFLYLYLRSFAERITWRKAIPHFILPFLFAIVSYIDLVPMIAKFPDAKDLPPDVLQSTSSVIRSIFKMAQLIVYYFLARRTLLSYQRSIRHLFSETSQIDLRWARWLVNGYLFIILSSLVIYGLMLKYPLYFNQLLLINMVIATPYIYMVTYKGVLQPTIWQLKPTIKKEVVEQEIQEVTEILSSRVTKSLKPGKNIRSDTKLEEIVTRITGLMENDKLYQETELTLQHLADKLQYPSYQVSQAINEGMRKNFYDLVNGYRVEEAKRLLLDPENENYTVLSVGFEAGFNSKTTFNTVFKKFTGQTPTDFRIKQRPTAVV